MPEASWGAGLTSAELAQKLREELHLQDIIETIRMQKYGIDTFFDTTLALPYDKVSRFWYGAWLAENFICPATLSNTHAFSKKPYEYGLASFWTALPPLTKDGQQVMFGFENDGHGGTGCTFFRLRRDAGVTRFFAVVGGAYTVPYGVDITAALPVDYQTKAYRYTIKVNRNVMEFYIGDEIPVHNLVALCVNSPNLAFTFGIATETVIAYPPTAIGYANIDVSRKQLLMVELVGNYELLVLPLIYHSVRVTDDDPLPPRVYRLYDAGTANLLRGLVIAAGSETSHPFPTFGYAGKTAVFRASQSGTLTIEVYTQAGNWLTYDTIAYVTAASPLGLQVYPIAGDPVLARISFLPSAFPCTITDAEVVLR